MECSTSRHRADDKMDGLTQVVGSNSQSGSGIQLRDISRKVMIKSKTNSLRVLSPSMKMALFCRQDSMLAELKYVKLHE